MVQSLKTFIKQSMFGPPGNKLRPIHRGLLKGLNFHVDTASKSMRLMGLDETEITADVQALAAQATTAMDIGANDGWYTQYFASLPNIKKVFAFEPEDVSVKALHENLKANDPAFNSKVTVVAKMVGNKNDDKWVSVDSLADQFVGTLLLKIDVDGGELDVLHGAANTLKQFKCLLVIETHSPELEKGCIAYLQELGFQCRIIPPGWYRLFVREARVSGHNQWFVATRPS